MAPIAELRGRRVFPGEPLCTIEEFLPGDGVYVDDGVIRAARFGQVEIDFANRRISVKPVTGKPRLPRRNSVVYGVAIGAPREELMLVKIFADERLVPYNGSFTGILHILQASDSPQQRSIYDYVKPGDILRATSLSPAPVYVLSIKRPQDGVIMAFCSVCGAPLHRVPGSNKLVCLRCGNEEQRKVSPLYVLTVRRKR
ncbi:conserved archaeal protein [Hyperthermus butylicus DSM 5456]|uniref:Exosome complex component Csl4 n=1 Tax=Hyperthermus butylicus (strain DSM 5456 / JCM 9403 / PLM1-5) TaxID=415426 RepID=A2BNA3_HYPBU|nr:conserved archaeal protein [Hyperthermus butylicus DSM 5456]